MNDVVFLKFVVIAPVLLLSLSVHECAHAWTAYKLGDPTAKQLGRVTLFPLSHLDFTGVVLFVMTFFLSKGTFSFGWGKPVPVDIRNFKSPRIADTIVSIAGPVSNVLLAFLLGLPLRLMGGAMLPSEVANFLYIGVGLNASLAVFNLIPIYPLDGFHVVANVLPPRLSHSYLTLMAVPFVPLLLMGVLLSGFFDPVIRFLHIILVNLAMGM